MISIFPKTPLDINKTYHVSIDYTLEFMKSETEKGTKILEFPYG